MKSLASLLGISIGIVSSPFLINIIREKKQKKTNKTSSKITLYHLTNVERDGDGTDFMLRSSLIYHTYVVELKKKKSLFKLGM